MKYITAIVVLVISIGAVGQMAPAGPPTLHMSVGVEFSDEKSVSNYLGMLQGCINAKWHKLNPSGSLPKIESGTSSAVKLTIVRDGAASILEAVPTPTNAGDHALPTGNPDIDAMALSAVQQCRPFMPLPPAYKGDSLALLVRFRYFLAYDW